MPKSQQILLALAIVLFVLNIIVPVIGVVAGIDYLNFSSLIVKIMQFSFIVIFVIFTYRQIRRKGWK
ncbi:hypothetical protein NGH92_08760 [Staphylococcus succinus]|uniref:hypothetical protein n=1 Tax=Staphylococcus TaxID=1279 RepID=UPI0008F4AB33|nr:MULTISPECIES: hypothetical protein [Staphylococcus]MEB8124920.1 hypothetical protein [Staphylococcus succinus]OIJ28913.1 hypothetical protein BK821_13060 [Staphylococcus sp. LCT-H4]PTJ81511.1 hypothetical protein BU055_11030 [Staphylococcus succinus]